MFSKSFNMYSILHVLIYGVLGYFIRNEWLFVIIISILWEVLEYILNKLSNNSLWKEIKINKILDVILNLLGYYIGSNIIL
jgi:hypothetical protein